jgi:MYXO-CTERM domain-containing protein
VVYRIQKQVVISLGSLAVGSLAALVASSCAQNERGEPASMLRASATFTAATPTFTAAPTLTIIRNPCLTADCSAWDDKNPCTYHCQIVGTSYKCGVYDYECDDLNACTDDSCDVSTGKCVARNNSDPCSDGDLCTINDTCSRGSCEGAAMPCDDNNVCTADSCKAGECGHAPVDPGALCDDQNGCTEGDACNANGVCVGSGGPDCDDSDPCTKNSCQNDACYHSELEPVGTPCLNPNKCLVNAACNAQGECTSAEEKNCDDNNPCTVDSCDPEVGCVSEPDDTLTCTDGNVCTLNDTCVDGVCTPETGIKCQAIDDCHDAGECDPTNGICSDPRKADGEVCENTGTCSAGRCMGGTPDPVGEGGAPSTGEGGEAAVGEGGAVSTGGSAPTADAGEDAGGRLGNGGRAGTGGRGAVLPPADAGEEGQEPTDQEEFKREPGGCSIGAANEPTERGFLGFLTLLGIGMLGFGRRRPTH